MRRHILIALIPAIFVFVAPALAQTKQQPPQITCAELPKADEYVNTKLRPGPNTDAAKKHLAAAKSAKSDAQCAAELKQVDYYAKRSAAADKHMAGGGSGHVQCADMLHQGRPGGTDYKGPPVAGCPQR